MYGKKIVLILIAAIPILASAGGLTAEECLALYKQDMEKCAKMYEYDEARRRECERQAMNSFAECLKEPMGEADRTFSVIREFFHLHGDSDENQADVNSDEDADRSGYTDTDESVRKKCREQAEAYRKDCVAGGKTEEVCLDEAYKEYLRCIANNR